MAIPIIKPEDCITAVTAWPRTAPCRRRACDHTAQVEGGHCPCCFSRIMTEPYPRPTVVVLCGSTRFFSEFRAQNLRLTLEGKIVLSIGCDTKADHDLEQLQTAAGSKVRLDDLHKRKIDMADEVFIINPGGYIGESTRSEIEYAEWYEKKITYLECPHNWTPWRPSRAEGVSALRACTMCAEIQTR